MFFIRWTGYGISVPVFIIIGIFGVSNMTRAVYGSSFMATHPSVFWLGLALGGCLCWWMGLSLKSEEPKIVHDAKTGQDVTVQKTHTLYGIPMQWWGLAAMIAGLFLAVKGSPAPIHYHRPVIAQSNVENEPSADRSAFPDARSSEGAANGSSVKAPAAEPEIKPEQNAAPGSAQTPPVTDSQAEQEAIRLYPALGVIGSSFNGEFLALREKYIAEHPDYFSDPDWPVKLAKEVGKSAH